MDRDEIKQTPMPPYAWQQSLWAGFTAKVTSQRLPHALLLAGVEGVGAELLAQTMARYLLCHSPIEDVACGRCRGCMLFIAGTHPDYLVLELEDGATQIKVDQVRSCVEFVAKTPHFESYKAVVVQASDKMNINASNALLKSLEEPAGQTVFILVTSRVSAILPTIRSRCQLLDVALPQTAEALSWLAEQGVEEPERWLAQAGGAPLLARLWATGDFAEHQTLVYRIAYELIAGRIGAQAAAVEWQKLDVERLISMQLFALESVLKAKMGGGEPAPILKPLYDLLKGLDNAVIFRLREKLLSKHAQWRANPNLNGVMLSEEMAMDWHALAQMAQRMVMY